MYFLCCSMYFCVVLCIVCFVTFSVLFVCICVLNYCHRVATQLQLNISYHIISYHIISYHISYSKQSACTMLSSVACLVLPHFPHYLINGTIFDKILLNIKCVLILYTILSETFLILRRTEQDIVNVRRSSCKVLVILVTF